MTMQNQLDLPPVDMAELKRVSARLGADPMLVQSAGGNTSIKHDDVMWIKASGTLLEEAEERDIFVPVDLPRLRDCISREDPLADQPKQFLADTSHTSRPSIETSLHAIFSQRIVLHVHCIHTLAHAVRTDAMDLLHEPLEGLDWVMVPDVGVVVRQDASSGARALLQCLADVLVRVPEEAPLNYLSDARNAELLNWDAEKYRQSLDV